MGVRGRECPAVSQPTEYWPPLAQCHPGLAAGRVGKRQSPALWLGAQAPAPPRDQALHPSEPARWDPE